MRYPVLLECVSRIFCTKPFNIKNYCTLKCSKKLAFIEKQDTQKLQLISNKYLGIRNLDAGNILQLESFDTGYLVILGNLN